MIRITFHEDRIKQSLFTPKYHMLTLTVFSHYAHFSFPRPHCQYVLKVFPTFDTSYRNGKKYDTHDRAIVHFPLSNPTINRQ